MPEKKVLKDKWSAFTLNVKIRINLGSKCTYYIYLDIIHPHFQNSYIEKALWDCEVHNNHDYMWMAV